MATAVSSDCIPRWRTIIFILSGTGLLLAALTLYTQTQHAFRHLIVPLAERFIPGQLEIQNGSLTFPGSVELMALSYHAPESGFSVQIDRLFLRVSAMALLRHRKLLIEDLSLERGTVRIARESKPASSTDRKTEAPGNESVLFLPGTVQRLRVKDLSISIRTDSDAFTASNVDLTMGEIGPGRTGTFDLHGDVSYDDLPSQARWKGNVLVTGTLEESHGRDRITWKATNDVVLHEWLKPGSPAGSKPIMLHHSFSGNYDVTSATVHNSSSVTARYGSALLGEFSLELTRTERLGGAVMDAGLLIQELTAETLNLALPEEGPIRIRSTHLDGRANIHAEGNRYAIAFTMNGRNLQAVSGADATPPLDIEIQQAGAADWGSKVLTIDRFQLRVVENDRVRLTGEIGRPLRISLSRDVADSDHAAMETTPESEGTLTVSRVDVRTLQRWLQVFGLERFQGVRTGQFNGTITVSSRGQGRAIDWKGNLTISEVVIAGGDNRATMEPMTFAHEFQGTVSDLTVLDLKSWKMTGAIHNRIRGTMIISGTINLRNPTEHPSVKGSLGLADVPGEIFNPVLARWTDTRVAHSRLNGTAKVELTGDTVTWKIKMGGRRIALWLPKSRQTTIPLDVDLSQKGNLDRTAGVLQLDEAIVRVFERSRPVITAVLNKPVRLPLPGDAQDQTMPRLDTRPADFDLKINRLEFQQISSRLSTLNLTPLDQIRTGYIDAQVALHWRGLSEPASASGYLNITDLRLDAGTMHISKPLRLKTTFDATMSDFSSIQITKLTCQAFTKSTILAETRLSGSADLNDASLDLALSFAAADMPAFLATLGVLDEQQQKLISRGRIEVQGKVVGHGLNDPISLQVKAHAREIRLQPLPGQLLSYTLHAQGNLEVNEDRTVIDFKPVDLTVEAAGKPAGSLTLNGTWPIAPSETWASVHIIAKNFDGGPFAELSGFLPGRIPGPLPIDADVTVALDARNGNLALRGLETIGPVRVARTDGGPEAATLRIEHDVNLGRDQLQVDNLRLTADRPQGVPDHITTTGRIRRIDNRGGQLTGHVASLDAGWYATLLSHPKSSPPPGSRPPSVKQPADRQASSHAATAVMGLEIDLSIGSISYGQLKIGPGRLTSKSTDERLHVKLETTGVAGGWVVVALDIDSQKELPEIRWSGKGQDLSMAPILAALSPGREPALNGSGSFETSGNGVLADGPLRDHLTGTADITIAKGQFIQSKALSFLAKYTNIQELEQLGFDSYQSTWHFNNGTISIDRFSVTGSTASFHGTGSIARDDKIEGRIFVKIGPSLRKHIKIPCMSALLATPDGFTTLPFALRITGAANNPDYSIDTAALDYAKGSMTGLVGTMKSLLRGCREDGQGSLSK